MNGSKKVMVVTGSSRGIGAATAIAGVKQGYAVCINYRNKEAEALAVEKQIQEMGGESLCVRADVSKECEVNRLFNEVDECLGSVTALVNNVGILQQKMRIIDMSEVRLNQVFTTNITSAFLCSREAVRRMSTENGGKGGAIVNVSSAASRLGSAGEYVDYAASKGAIDTLTIGLANEVAGENIRVNCVRPGFIFTDIHSDGGEPNRVQRLASALPMKRGGQPHEVADAILWLLSQEASYVTGSFIDLAGGK